MSLNFKNLNGRLVKEITIILIIKIVLLLTIKHIWFDAPTIPKNFDNQVAEHIAGDNISH
ncbi:cytochrome oxidase putative small subunit CydP, partial [Acinetobacter junii]